MKKFLLSFAALAAGLVPAPARGDDWPQWMGPKRDSVWRETGLLEKFPAAGPKVLWRVPVQYGYSGPAVAGGRVYVADYATKDKFTSSPGARGKLQGTERVLCLDARDGKEIWKHEYDCPYSVSYPGGPRCTPTVHEGKVYTLGAMGNLLCLDAAKGDVVWSHDLKADYKVKTPMWGFCGHPLVDGRKLICLVGGKGSIAVAFHKDTGKEIWRALDAPEPGYSAPTMIEAGGTRQLVIFHAESVNGLDPETGKVYWSVPLKPDYGMAIAVPRQLGEYLYASGQGNDKAVLLKLAADRPAADVVWRGQAKKAVYCTNSTPFLEEGMIYGCDWNAGQLRGVRLESGERLWETLKPTSGGPKPAYDGTAFLVKNGDRFFLASETGDLVIARLSPKGYEEVSRCHLLDPAEDVFGRKVLWSHPAFAEKCVFARNNKELVCVSLAADGKP
jgi:outer membrane protein assembly factor BamB